MTTPFEKYVLSLADTLVDEHQLHPDDAAELLDIYRKDVVAWEHRKVPIKVAADTLMVRLQALMAIPTPNPIPAVALWGGGIVLAALALGYVGMRKKNAVTSAEGASPIISSPIQTPASPPTNINNPPPPPSSAPVVLSVPATILRVPPGFHIHFFVTGRVSVPSLAQYNVDRINQYRAQHGLPALARDGTIDTFAQAGSQQLSQDHTAHAHFLAQARGAPGFGSFRGENQGDPSGVRALDGDAVINGQKQVDLMLQMMMDEGPGGGHYDNMMNPKYTRVGIGIVYVGNTLYMTNDFSS
jgi:uncharacterized protein YkwD